ncbi:hypothetical protein KIN20_037317 [Parelaphostrongylus tenuis]|uniref:Uncharacterized protein n=1 Tax=Parelaphostrongylus tenuis TaxID=148309 RepID=A0AAD5WLY2_PARTN|nr:hypothetical protein KIN20_037317 [Parelaphostrongylus tenuis]
MSRRRCYNNSVVSKSSMEKDMNVDVALRAPKLSRQARTPPSPNRERKNEREPPRRSAGPTEKKLDKQHVDDER